MGKKSKILNSFGCLVYSTDKEMMDRLGEKEETFTPGPNAQQLRIVLDSKRRKGKMVTLITGFEGSEADLKELAKQLKIKCGTGGSAKDGEIVIQGDCREEVKRWLKEWGYRVR